MKALVMHPYYISKILDGEISFDARGYDTYVKGDICIYDSKLKALVGIITITGTHPITVEEYYEWHNVPLDMKTTNMNHKCYAWDFINPRRIVPIVIGKGSSRTWVEFDESKVNFIVLNKLF